MRRKKTVYSFDVYPIYCIIYVFMYKLKESQLDKYVWHVKNEKDRKRDLPRSKNHNNNDMMMMIMKSKETETDNS